MNPEDLHLATLLKTTNTLSLTDCQAVITKCQDRLRRLRIEDPMVGHTIPKCWRKDSYGKWVQDVPVREGMDVWLPYTSLTPKELMQLANAPVPHRAIVRHINGSYKVAIIRTGLKPSSRWNVDDAFASREDARLAAKEITKEIL